MHLESLNKNHNQNVKLFKYKYKSSFLSKGIYNKIQKNFSVLSFIDYGQVYVLYPNFFSDTFNEYKHVKPCSEHFWNGCPSCHPSMTFTRIRTCNLSSELQLITTRPWQLKKRLQSDYVNWASPHCLFTDAVPLLKTLIKKVE